VSYCWRGGANGAEKRHRLHGIMVAALVRRGISGEDW